MRKISAEEMLKLHRLADSASAKARLLETRLQAIQQKAVLGLYEYYTARTAIRGAIKILGDISRKLDTLNTELLCDNWKVRNKKK